MKQTTQYPWDGKITISVNPLKSGKFAISLRIPGWAGNQPVPTNLYKFTEKALSGYNIRVNGKIANLSAKDGYVSIDRQWKKGDVIELNLPITQPTVGADISLIIVELVLWSKKRLLGNLASIKELLFSLEPAHGEAKTNPFMEMMTAEMQRSVQEVYNYSGSYLSYSLSSSCQCLKVEPYLIEASEDNTYVKVTHMSAYNTTHRGVGLFNNHQNGYIFFNERESPQMALFSIYLQLPMYDFPPFLKGLYLSLDYNRNPIARRILFVKQGDSTDMEEFLELKGELVPLDKLTELQKKYYDYTCQEGDCIRTCMVPSPQLNENDLEREKKILSL
jgi:hypothetical protein